MGLREWASEGESKAAVWCFGLTEVEETEKKLRYEIKHMIVCDERMCDLSHQAGWHRRRVTLVPALDWDGSFFITKMQGLPKS